MDEPNYHQDWLRRGEQIVALTGRATVAEAELAATKKELERLLGSKAPPRNVQQYVVGFIVDERWKEVMLILKARPAWQRNLLNGIGGHMNPGETPLAAMVRECQEESGLRLPPGAWVHRVSVTFDECVVHFYAATMPEGFARSEGRWDEPVRWFPVAALPHNLVPNVRWLLPLCLDLSIVGPVRLHASDLEGVMGGAF